MEGYGDSPSPYGLFFWRFFKQDGYTLRPVPSNINYPC